MNPPTYDGPVLFGYDGSDLAGFAITHAATQLARPRDALVVCVWQPADVGFEPVEGQHFDADQATQVRLAAEQTAAYGAKLAERAGFSAQGVAVKASPIWKGIVATADENAASLIVLGAHRHNAVGRLLGHVTTAVLAHFSSSVLIVHQPGAVGHSRAVF